MTPKILQLRDIVDITVERSGLIEYHKKEAEKKEEQELKIYRS